MMLVSFFHHDAIEAEMGWGGRGNPIERNVRFHTHMQPYRPALHADTGKVQPQTDCWAKAETLASTALQTHKAEENRPAVPVPLSLGLLLSAELSREKGLKYGNPSISIPQHRLPAEAP